MSIRKNLVAYLALFIALGGTSYAAVGLSPGSVGTRQLRNGAVTDAKVRARSLTSRVFAKGALKPSGYLRFVVRSQQGQDGVCAESPCDQHATVFCQQGEQATGGGFLDGGGTVVSSQPQLDGAGRADGWSVTSTGTPAPTAYAVCATSQPPPPQ